MNALVQSSFFLCAASFALVTSACGSQTLDGGSNASSSNYACDNRALDSTCADYPSGTTRTEAETTCDGKVVELPCSLGGAVGRCTVTDARGTLTNTYYADGSKPRTDATARASCQQLAGVFRTP